MLKVNIKTWKVFHLKQYVLVCIFCDLIFRFLTLHHGAHSPSSHLTDPSEALLCSEVSNLDRHLTG